MRLHRIKLRDYRGVTESEVTFAAQGVTIIEGDNEVGKTSLAQAVSLILDHRDDSNKRVVKAVQPIGRDAGSEVEVEISTGPYRFVYAKRWHRQRQTTLSVLEPRPEQLSGREAHDRVNAILDETLDRPLWQALRLEQGVALTQPGFDVASLGRALDAAAGGEQVDPAGDDLWERIGAERDRYWTPTFQPSRERYRAATLVEEARTRVVEFERRLSEVEADTEEVARLVADSVILQARQVDCERARAELDQRSARVAELRSRARQLGAERDAAQAERDRAALEAERRVELVAAARATADAVAARQLEIDQAEPARAAVQTRHEGAQAALAAARAARLGAEATVARATRDRDHLRQVIELEQLTERRDRVVDAQRRLSEAERLAESIRVDDRTVVGIEAAHLEVAKARAAAEASAALITTTALRSLTVEVDGQAVALAAGQADQRAVTGAFELVVPDLVRVRVQPGGETQALAERLEGASESLAAQCQAVGVDDLDQARSQASAAREAARTRQDAAEAIGRDLRDLTLEALSQKIERISARLASYLEARAAAPPLPMDFELAQAEAGQAEAALHDRQQELERAEAAAEAAAMAVTDTAVSDAVLAARSEQARSAAQQAAGSLEAARCQHPDEGIEAALVLAEASMGQRAVALAGAERELADEDPESLEELVTNARSAVARVAATLHDNQERRRELGARLQVLGEQGLSEELDDAHTTLLQREREQERLEARAEAAKLLYDSFAARRAEAHARYVAPFRQKIEQLGRIVFGPTFQVELDPDLRVARRTLNGITVDFEQLSTGAQEQLGIVSRLACAALVSGDGGAPVIFDDALGWTDPRRLDRMGAAIAVAGRECQIIVLTCTPGRYANVGSAEVINLSA